MANPASDEQLMLAFKTGDAKAFSTLVSRHRGPVYNFILRYVGHRQRAEDVLQETWLKVVRGSGQWQPTAKFTTWVYTIARNLCVDASRRDRHRKAASLDAVGEGEDGEGRPLGDRVADTQPTPERSAHGGELRGAIEAALQKLPSEQREVFLRREYAGVPFKEIAEVTGVAENTVKSRMRYALEGLRKRLGDLGVDGELMVEEGVASSS